MRKALTIFMVATLALAFVVTSVYAGSMSEKMGKKTSQAVKASDLIGTSVQNRQGEDLGEISDLAVDPMSGHITFAVISAGGVLGIGDKLIPVPINALQFSEGKATLDISKNKLASAPTIDKENWVEMSSREQMENTYRFFGVRPYWKEQMEPMEEEKQMYEGY